MTLLRSVAIYCSTVFFMTLYWLALLLPVLVILCLPAEKRRHQLRWLLLGFGWMTVRIAWRPFFRVDYRDLSGGCREPGVVIVNHRAATDGFLVAVMGMNVAQTVNGWPLKTPIMGWMARLAGYLNITGWDYETLKRRAAGVLEQGGMIVSYPEGTRSEGKKMNPFHSGIFHVAKELGVPVYMLCIAGNQFMPDRKFRFREFRDLAVRLLPPLSKDEVERCPSAYALKQKVFRRMEQQLAEMDEELDR
ncbi:MAG: 1-acyl-sn-glycerol-3-phosphate acyltransferase [Lentisphaeria bacterium]|nr:1-acyl-sn-glycerol-3-phosphate acyltransferase [Lentisphaeria bacterium]